MNDQDYELGIDWESDYVIYSCRAYTRFTGGYNCRQVGQFAEYDEMLAAIREDMNREQFWPNVWYVNDHGNTDLLRLVDKDGVMDSEIVQSWV